MIPRNDARRTHAVCIRPQALRRESWVGMVCHSETIRLLRSWKRDEIKVACS